MLTAEQARQRLEAMRRPTGDRKRAGLLTRLSSRSLLATLGLEGAGKLDAEQAGSQIDGLSGRSRRAALDGVLPGLGAELAWMWEDRGR